MLLSEITKVVSESGKILFQYLAKELRICLIYYIIMSVSIDEGLFDAGM